MDRRSHRPRTVSDHGGMTLAEVTVAMAVFSYFMIVTLSSVSAINKINARDTNDRELLNQARIVMEKLLWGPKTKNSTEKDGIAEAISYQMAGNTFHYTLPDGVKRSIVRNQDELTFHKANNKTTIYDPNGEGNPPEPQNYSTDLTFTQTSINVLRIDLVLGKIKNGKWYHASLSTAISLRNTTV